jgi:hypothetical protein
MGGDEVDCLTNVNGELVLFELKDKEFSLGNAYSFGAKIGIIRPEHAVILTTEVVGNDAKEHFERSRLAQRSPHVRWDLEEETTKVLYIEGTDALCTEVRVEAVHGEEFFMGACFDNAAVIHYKYQVCVTDCR